MILYKILNFLFFSTTICSNLLTIKGFGPFNSLTNVSNTFNTSLTTPYWSSIYLAVANFWMLIFIVGHIIHTSQINNYVKNMGILTCVSFILNTSWNLIYSLGTKDSILVSVFISFFLFINLLIIQNKIYIFKERNNKRKTILLDIPFSLYLGWASFLFIQNLGTCLKAWLINFNCNVLFYGSIITLLVFNLSNLYYNKNFVTMIVFLYYMAVFTFEYVNSNHLLFYFSLSILCVSFLLTVIKGIMEITKYKKRKKTYFYNQIDGKRQILTAVI